MASTNPARGMRDFLPADVRKRNYVINIIKEVYESYGFEPLETPAVENIETLLGKYGEEGNQLVFKILKRGEAFSANLKGFAGIVKAGSYGTYEENDPSYATAITREFCDLALRYDLTVPLARVVANNKNELPKFFKRYQIQPVWRADRPARGRFREFYQCDVDAIGSNSMVVEAELISAVSQILTQLGFKDFIVRINHRKLLSGLLTIFVSDQAMHTPVLIALDKLDKIGSEGVIRELCQIGLSEEKAEGLLGVFDITEKQTAAMTRDPDIHNTILEMLDEHIGKDDDVGRAGIADLRCLSALLSSSPIEMDWRIDASLARGLSYYTGTIMEVSVPDLAGSLGGGGRYDGLIGMFGKEQIPACGFSLGLERILVIMEERSMFPPEIAESNAADVMVTVWSDEKVIESLKLASELRSHGFRVTVYPEPDKLGKQFKYADAIKVPWVCVLGENEIAEKKVTLKNMQSGEQQTYPRSEIASKITK